MKITKEDYSEAMSTVAGFIGGLGPNVEDKLEIMSPPITVVKQHSEIGDHHEDGVEGILLAQLKDSRDNIEIDLCFVVYPHDELLAVAIVSGFKLKRIDKNVELV